MAMVDDPVDGTDVEWFEPDAGGSTARVLEALDAFDQARKDRDRARTIGMGRVFVLLLGIAMVLTVVVTLNQLITEAVHGIEQGL